MMDVCIYYRHMNMGSWSKIFSDICICRYEVMMVRIIKGYIIFVYVYLYIVIICMCVCIYFIWWTCRWDERRCSANELKGKTRRWRIRVQTDLSKQIDLERALMEDYIAPYWTRDILLPVRSRPREIRCKVRYI